VRTDLSFFDKRLSWITKIATAVYPSAQTCARSEAPLGWSGLCGQTAERRLGLVFAKIV
jgi:hypothetical protein